MKQDVAETKTTAAYVQRPRSQSVSRTMTPLLKATWHQEKLKRARTRINTSISCFLSPAQACRVLERHESERNRLLLLVFVAIVQTVAIGNEDNTWISPTRQAVLWKYAYCLLGLGRWGTTSAW